MSFIDKYLHFIQEQGTLANMERMQFNNEPLVAGLMDKVKESSESNSLARLKEYIENHLVDLLNLVPHLAMQVYVTTMDKDKMSENLKNLLKREDIPAKTYGLIKQYAEMLEVNVEEIESPLTLATDENILNSLMSLDYNNVAKFNMFMTLRLKTDSNMDHFIDLFSTFMLDTKVNAMYKITMIHQLEMMARNGSPATKRLEFVIDNKMYSILLDGTYQEKNDYFLKAVKYFLDNSEDNFKMDKTFLDVVLSTATLYRTLHLNEEYLLNSEANIKSFCYCVLKSLYVGSNKDYTKYLHYPSEYENEEGWKEASYFIKTIYCF